MDDLINRQAVLEIIQSMYPGMPRVPWMRKDWQKRYEPYIRTENAIRELPTAWPEQPKWVRKVERMHNKALAMPYIQKPFAWALYQVWKEYDKEETERRTDGTEDTD